MEINPDDCVSTQYSDGDPKDRLLERRDGQDLFDALLHALKETSDPQQRQIIVSTLAAFRDPTILRQSLALVLDPALDVRETFVLLFQGMGERQTEKLPFEFLKDNYDAVVKRFPSGATADYRAFLPLVGRAFCDEPSRLELAALFEDKVKEYVGGPRNYAQVLETIRLCEAHRSSQAADLAEFFSRQ